MNLIICLLLSLLAISEGQPFFSVTSPSQLASKFGSIPQDVTHANFGDYKQNVYSGKLLFQRHNRLGCDKYNKFHQSVQIIVAYRGTCTFVTKARHAQYAGAKMLILIDNKEEAANSIVMADDGTGHDIKIPTIMVTKKAGDVIKEYFGGHIKSGKVEVEVRLKEKEVHPEKIKLDIFYNPLDLEILDIIAELSGLIEKCRHRIELEPHLEEESCEYCSLSFQSKNCLCGGKYCLFKNHQQIRGVTALEEVLRELCLYYENSLESYYNYIVAMKNEGYGFQDSDQVNMGLESAQVKPRALQECIDKSFDNQDRDQCQSNTLLEKQRAFRLKYPDLPPRSILINNRRYTGLMEPEDVRDAIIEVMGDPDDC